jgi:hypothetical protein
VNRKRKKIILLNNTKIMYSSYWLRWTFNCAFGELIGIALAGAIAFSVNFAVGEPQTFFPKLLVLLAAMISGLVEGSLLGFFQWRVLKERFPRLPRREWIFYTVAIAVLGWFLGMLPSLFFIPQEVAPLEPAGVDIDNPYLFAGLSIAVGLVLGALFGLFQWFSFRKYAQKAARWIIANALGWGIGIGWIYLAASLPDENTSLLLNVGLGLMGGALAGLSVGAVTGIFLIRMRPKPLAG